MARGASIEFLSVKIFKMKMKMLKVNTMRFASAREPRQPEWICAPRNPCQAREREREREWKERGERGKKERVKVHDMTRQLTHDIRLVLHLRGGGQRRAKGGDLS